jgi:uncharacterized protein YggL (DUF469 family)
MNWPWPDDRLQRRTRVAQMYRERLADTDAAACAEIDEIMTALGQEWVYDGATHHERHELLTLDEAAQYADVARNTVQKWISRGHLERRVNADRQVAVLMADLIDFQQRRLA